MDRNATLRGWLNEAGFDWESGLIVWQDTGEDNYPGWHTPEAPGVVITKDHEVLDRKFYCGYGGPECPRIFAQDKNAIYFPGQYDGSTWLERIVTDPGFYTLPGNATPYPGG